MALPILDGNQSATTLSTILLGGEHTPAHTVVSLGSTAISNITSAISGSVVSISNFPATQTIAGTVTANPTGTQTIAGTVTANINTGVTIGGSISTQSIYPVAYSTVGGMQVAAIGSGLPISGTVTANGGDFAGDFGGSIANKGVQIGYENSDRDSFRFVTLDDPLPVILRGSQLSDGQTTVTQPVTGTVTARLADVTDPLNDNGTCAKTVAVKIYDENGLPISNAYRFPISGSVTIGAGTSQIGTVTVGNSVTIGSLPTLTPQLPRVTFIDGSGTVTTANTAVTVFASSTTRSYLLVQVTTGSAFVNVGATATTVNGISLTAGQGYAWETTIPQGIVSLISTTTSSRYVAKQA